MCLKHSEFPKLKKNLKMLGAPIWPKNSFLKKSPQEEIKLNQLINNYR